MFKKKFKPISSHVGSSAVKSLVRSTHVAPGGRSDVFYSEVSDTEAYQSLDPNLFSLESQIEAGVRLDRITTPVFNNDTVPDSVLSGVENSINEALDSSDSSSNS